MFQHIYDDKRSSTLLHRSGTRNLRASSWREGRHIGVNKQLFVAQEKWIDYSVE